MFFLFIISFDKNEINVEKNLLNNFFFSIGKYRRILEYRRNCEWKLKMAINFNIIRK